MKRFLCLCLCGIFLFSCGCTAFKKSHIRDAVSQVVSDFISLNEDIESDNIEKIEETAVTPSDIDTPAYNLLDKKRKQIYRILLTAANNMQEGWFSCGEAEEDYESDVDAAYDALVFDNPQIFWLPPSFIIAKSGKYSCVAFKIDDQDCSNDYPMTKSERDAVLPQFQQAVDSISATARTFEDDFQKELYIHDYLCENIVYEQDYKQKDDKSIYTAYGALINGVCVCEGYSRAMQLICQTIGIKCYLVYGTAENEAHMWNCISINGEFYHLDVTWDDSEDYGATHTYFNITEQEALKDREILKSYNPNRLDNEYNFVHETCTSTDENYYNKYGYYVTDSAGETADNILHAFDSGLTRAELKLDLTNVDNLDDVLQTANSRLPQRLNLTNYVTFGDCVLVFW